MDFQYAESLKLLLPAYDSITLFLIGCGGTGSWLAPAVVRVGKVLEDRFDKSVKFVFVDPDTVEQKNIYRQNFCQAEVGVNKAEALATRYGLAWGVEILAVQEPVSSKINYYFGDLNILIGCVDGLIGRQGIAENFNYLSNRQGSSIWWLDSGNEASSGQILLGRWGKNEHAFDLPGFCSWLPLPAEQHPELVGKSVYQQLVEPGGESDLSCAEIALADSQGLAINQRMASEAADYLVRMLITKDLRKFATYIDLESGVAKSRYIRLMN